MIMVSTSIEYLLYGSSSILLIARYRLHCRTQALLGRPLCRRVAHCVFTGRPIYNGLYASTNMTEYASSLYPVTVGIAPPGATGNRVASALAGDASLDTGV